MSISSDEINLLVQHYLQELGYSHAAFAFGCESEIPTKAISKRRVQPGALVYLIQKGIMFADMEAAAENALEDPNSLFARQLDLLRTNLRQSTELVDEQSSSTRKMKVFPTSDESIITPFYLNQYSSLILRAHKSPVLVCAWDSTSNYMATGSGSGSIVIWKCDICDSDYSCVIYHIATIINNRSHIKNIQNTNKNEYHDPQDITALEWLSFSENKCPTLASGSFDGKIRLFAGNDGSEITTFKYHSSPIVSLRSSPNKEYLLSVGSEGTIAIIKEMEIKFTQMIQGEIIDACWSDDQTVLIASSKSIFKINISNDNKDTEIETIITLTNTINQLLPEKGHELFAIIDNSGFLTVLDKMGSKKFSRQVHTGAICCASWLPSFCSNANIGPLIATGGTDCTVKVSNLKDLISISLDDHSSTVYCVDYGPKGDFIASAARDTINIWSHGSKKLVISYKAESNVVSLCWSPNGRFLIIGLFSGDVAMIDFEQLC